MNEFKKARGLAVASGIVFIVNVIFANIFFFKNYRGFNNIEIIVNLVLYIIPIIILGIMLIMGKMHYGFIVPTILMIVKNVFWVIYFQSISIFGLIRILLVTIPLIILLIVFIMCSKKGEKSSALKVLCIIPTALLIILTVLGLILGVTVGTTDSSLFYDEYIVRIISQVAFIVALALCGAWIFINIDSENVHSASGQNKQYPQQSIGQPYYPQKQTYYPQQGGYQQPYAPNYNQQPVNYQQGMAQPYGQSQYNQPQYQQPQYNQPVYQQSVEPQPALGATNEIEMLKAYRELLDNGTITQEEFDQKKKQILGL